MPYKAALVRVPRVPNDLNRAKRLNGWNDWNLQLKMTSIGACTNCAKPASEYGNKEKEGSVEFQVG
jgi:hypothetical protein